jgi:Raf kinase inhibitor-like YbhB/YbcL family protein
MTLSIRSEAFAAGQPVPVRYTDDGDNLSPPLSWSGLPAGTRELALICDDPDAPRAEPFVHWVMYKIPSSAAGLPEGLPTDRTLRRPITAVQGRNSWKKAGYGGPSPPRGHGTHHYHFHIYALDEPLNLQPGMDKDALLQAMAGHILDEGDLVGTYER